MQLTWDPTPHLTKHHAWGNEYLVLLDRDGHGAPTPRAVQRLCDRAAGIGADGLIHALPVSGDADALMNLYNADGGEAEMSGNGIRCLAQALLLEGWATPADVVVQTRVGTRSVVVIDGPVDEADGMTTHTLSVDMGPVRVIGGAAEWADAISGRAVWATAGNPHLVLEVEDSAEWDTVDLVTLGEKVNAATPDGANVNLVAAGPDPSAITLRTYERGVGITPACGTGACASAVAAAGWGLVGAQAAGPAEPAHDGADGADAAVTVHMPGGEGTVVLGTTVHLIGPVTTRRDDVVEYWGS